MKNWWKILLVLLGIGAIAYLTCQGPEETWDLTFYVQDKLAFLTERYVWLQDGNHFRKFAHSVEFFALGVFVANLFAKSHWAYGKSFAVCGILSLADECLKDYLPTREFDSNDMVFDLVGYQLGIILVLVIYAVAGKIREVSV